MKKLAAIAFVPGLIMAILFAIWGDSIESFLKPAEFNKQFSLESAWLIALGLMVSDLFLPIPASAVMSAIGSKYGLAIGFFINFSGLMLAGFTAYFSAALFSSKGASWLCNESEIEEYGQFFNKWGGLAIIISRLLPILPEVTSLMAGFAKMNLKKYSLSLTLGNAAVALLYSWLGSSTADEPVWGIAVAVCIPCILWLLLGKLYKPADSN